MCLLYSIFALVFGIGFSFVLSIYSLLFLTFICVLTTIIKSKKPKNGNSDERIFMLIVLICFNVGMYTSHIYIENFQIINSFVITYIVK